MDKSVKKLNADLSKLSHANAAEKKDAAELAKDRAAEKAALASIAAQEQALIDGFVNGNSGNLAPDAQAKLLTQLFGLGEKEIQTQDRFAKEIASDKAAVSKAKKAVTAAHKAALADLKPAEYHLSLKATNKDRKELGLKPLDEPLRHSGTTGSPWKPGPGRLSGGDTSHYQSSGTFESSIKGKQWAAVKATEGTGYTDPAFKARWAELGKKIKQGKMKLRMAYCFLDKGNGTGQAKHFLNALGIHGKLPAGTRLALDWEASALSSPQTLKDAANYIHKVTGTWPVIYCSGSNAAQAHRLVPHAPQWVAQWTNGLSLHNVPFVQYSDGPGYDHDVFNGNLKALEKFAGWS